MNCCCNTATCRGLVVTHDCVRRNEQASGRDCSSTSPELRIMYMFDRIALGAYAFTHNRYPLNVITLYIIILLTGTDEQLFQSVCLILQADWAPLSRAFPLPMACDCPHLVYICIVFINTPYAEKIPKHGHGEVPAPAAVRLLARGGPCGRCSGSGCLAARLAAGRGRTQQPRPCELGAGLGLSWPASCRSLPMQPQSGHSSSTPHPHANASKPRAEAESLGPRPTAKTPLRCKTQGRVWGDIHNCSMHRSSSTRHTNDQEPQVHWFASYRFRVCRHG